MIRNVLYVTDEQYEALFRGETITIDGQEYTKNDETAYARDDFEYTRLINMLDNTLIRPNTVYHEQIIIPKVEDLISVIEYGKEPQTEDDKPYYEWGYVILRGYMTNSDFINITPSNNNYFGKIKIWNNAEWQEMTEDYNCTSTNEELITLKIYPKDYGYLPYMILLPENFNFDIREIGIHAPIYKENGNPVYSSDINIRNLYKTADKLYYYGYNHIDDTFENNYINEIKFVNGGIDTINSMTCFKALVKMTVPAIDIILNFPQFCPITKFNCDLVGIIKDSAFRNCIQLEDNIYSYNYNTYCFTKSGIKEVNLNKNEISYIGSAVWDSCLNLKKVFMNKNCVISSDNINGAIFYNCSNLESATINTNMLTGRMFQGCSNLSNVILGKNITKLYSNVFVNCTNLINLNLPNSITYADSVFLNGATNLQNLTLETDWDCNLNISYSTKYTRDTLIAMINSLKDLTGTTAKTLTIGATNKAKLTADDIAIATSKNWSIA